jgi:hypothetical protein
MAASLYRTGSQPPQPPRDLKGVAQTYWEQLVTAKPPDHWNGGALLLLERLCRTAATAAYVQRRFERDPASDEALRLMQLLCNLNASVAGLAVKLRLTPQTTISPRSTGRNAEVGAPVDVLLGGRTSLRH